MSNTLIKRPAGGSKRLVLVVDDEIINREILGHILENDYDVLYAGDGQEALEMIRQHRDLLSILLLDIIMPVMDGLTLLRILKEDPQLRSLPVIVMTSDQSVEVESLRIGAIDFIPKPYSQPEVILARVLRTIELHEDRQTIQSTERDALTGLYNREFFYRYAQQYDQYHRDAPMDAIVMDVVHFHAVNERYGKHYGDEVLRRIGERLRGLAEETGSIACRRFSDTFMLYSPAGIQYNHLLERVSEGLSGEADASGRIRLRMGVYQNVDKEMDIERRFDRAKSAADQVRSGYPRSIAIYDSRMHDEEMFAEQLIEEFPRAIEQGQFRVHYQPKYDVQQEEPMLVSAEALVRWAHPTLGMVSPGTFIPLFEENGMIQQLDRFVWREAARQIADWKRRFGMAVPVSVNVSRVDMFDVHLIDFLLELVESEGLSPEDLRLEITETAYTKNAQLIIHTVNRLRDMGFRIEMDDFGTGYSSLGMLSNLPFDTLKLDRAFIQNAFDAHRDVRMLELILDIADYLSVPVIAEGVETEVQLQALKNMGCDIAQGYYFSRPLPAEEFEALLRDRIAQMERLGEHAVPDGKHRGPINLPYSRVANALAADYLSIYLVNTQTDAYVEYASQPVFQHLSVPRSGKRFFEECRDSVNRLAVPEDRARAMAAWDKENLLAELDANGAYTTTYRLMLDGKPRYISTRILRMAEDPTHVIIGVSDVDAQMRREQEFATVREKASRDALTGVKNKLAYVEREEEINAHIAEGDAAPFAVVVCDVNGLKLVNDTQGHKAGDRYLRDCCMVICEIFKHSPVFRIGGDEFVALLQGADYERRSELMDALRRRSGEARLNGGMVIACGIDEYRPGEDASLSAVFERADRQMYLHKGELKK